MVVEDLNLGEDEQEECSRVISKRNEAHTNSIRTSANTPASSGIQSRTLGAYSQGFAQKQL